MGFIVPGEGQIENMYIDDAWLVERYAGDRLWAWGAGWFGKLGDNTTDPKSSPVQTVAGGTNWKQVTCGYYGSGAIKTDGTLWMWGNNAFGELGDNTLTQKSSPVQTVAGGTNWKQMACGYGYTGAIKTDGTLWTWGRNNHGQLGDNTIVSKSSPVQIVTGGTNWKQMACGYGITGAIKTDGTLWMWGKDNYGQLGINSTVRKSSPVQTIAGGTNWKQVAVGGQHTAAIKTDGTLWSWGSNSYGELGDRTIIRKSSPVQTIAGGTNWKYVACGYSHTGAIKTDGTLWMWGRNNSGRLGDNTEIDKSSPVQTVAGGTNWKQVDCGQHTGAIKTDGTLWTWGQDGYGELGDYSTLLKSSPIQTITGGTNWKQVACANTTTLAISINNFNTTN